MAKRKTEKDYYALAESRGFKWVGENLPKNVHAKTLWECKEGHRWSVQYYSIYNKVGCPYCSGLIKKIEKDYHALASKQRLFWVGTKLPKNTKIKTLWECKKGHQWQATYSNINSGHNCPYCFGTIKKTKKDYYSLAKYRKFSWIGKNLPQSVMIKTWWKCKKRHEWEATYNTISMGSGCPYCSNKVLKIEKDYYSLTKYTEVAWVGKELPKSTKTKTLWRCKKCNYSWKTTYDNFQQGSACPKCAGTLKKVEKDYHNLVVDRDIAWVGKVLPKNVMTKTLWECKKCGHQWEARYNSIQRGQGCPHCQDRVNGSPVSKPQRKLNKLLYGSLNYPEDRYRIDVAIMRNSQKIAVEYDAQYWHQGREEHDEKRDRFLIFRGWKVLHIKSGILLPTRKQLKKKINKLLKNNINVVDLYLEDWKKEEDK